VVFCREAALLRSGGHDVVEYVRQNTEIPNQGILHNIRTGVRALWAWDTTRELRSMLRRLKPQLVHFHNTFPLISPAAYYVCKEEGVPVVQSLHNPRILCPAATLYREGQVCEDCLGRSFAWPGVVHACYHNSRRQTALVAGIVSVHRVFGTWRDKVDAYIAFTEFSRQKFIAAGLPARKIFLKPHFLNSDPGMKEEPGDYALFLGRLTREKGGLTLLKAWKHLQYVPLRIVGSGPLEQEVREFQQGNPSVKAFSHLRQQECFELMKGARFLVWPSEGYNETFGLVAMEAFACGTPVLASGVGAGAEIVKDGKTGLHFKAGNAEDLAAKVEWAWTHPREMGTMGRAARSEYVSKYTAVRNYDALMRIYDAAMQRKEFQNANLPLLPLPRFGAEPDSCCSRDTKGIQERAVGPVDSYTSSKRDEASIT
jgi:glycosyltransferase involved in cell wall biosynthesis